MSAACPEYAFDVTLRLAPQLDADARAALRRAFAALLDARGLVADGGGDAVLRHTVARDGGQAVDADRDAVREWARARPEIVDATVGPLVDLGDPSI